jgi:hypothetical protein
MMAKIEAEFASPHPAEKLAFKASRMDVRAAGADTNGPVDPEPD